MLHTHVYGYVGVLYHVANPDLTGSLAHEVGYGVTIEPHVTLGAWQLRASVAVCVCGKLHDSKRPGSTRPNSARSAVTLLAAFGVEFGPGKR